jgi:SCF-associated factor 1
VLAGRTDYLGGVLAEREEALRRGLPGIQYSKELLDSRPINVPALQHSGVIALAFGDYHSHALHADGTITAYGVEPRRCGTLGLGSTADGARFRGLKTSHTPLNRDEKLLPIANRRGRRVWFEHEKREWLQWLEKWICTPTAVPHYPEVFNLLDGDEKKQAAFSEWIEQEGRHWSDGPRDETAPQPTSTETTTSGTTAESESSRNDGLPAYFAISVAAAGWHTGALVLVDDEKAERTRLKWLADDDGKKGIPSSDARETALPTKSAGQIEYVWEKRPFPRIALPDGYEFPGEGGLQPWRDGMPTVEQLGLEEQPVAQD